jgi:predicted lipoprotein with Yx(FWY)xxD motif
VPLATPFREKIVFPRRSIGFVIGAALPVAGCATGPAHFSNEVLNDSKGMTPYTFDKNPAGLARNVWHVVKEPGGSMGGY